MNITKEEFDKKIIEGKEECIVDFYADWCGPCQMMMPVMEEIGKNHTVYKVNTDDQDELAFSYGVMSIPCIISLDVWELYHNGYNLFRSFTNLSINVGYGTFNIIMNLQSSPGKSIPVFNVGPTSIVSCENL